MERIEIRYVNEYRKKESAGGLVFVVLVSLGFISAVGALCTFLWVIR